MQNELADEFYREQQVARANELQQIDNDNNKANNIMHALPADVSKYIMRYIEKGPNDLTDVKQSLDKQNNEYTKTNNQPRRGWMIANTGAQGIFRPFHTHGTRHIKYLTPESNDYATFHMKNERPYGNADYEYSQT